MQQKVLLAISGGIDSAVAAYFLKEMGFDVTGLHLLLGDEDNSEVPDKLKIVSKTLGIDILHYDARQLFHDEVIQYFTRFHLAGLTPSPCVHCNPRVKWNVLLQQADALGIKTIATGHYIRVGDYESNRRIFRAVDRSKDQSYYLWNLRLETISRAIAPLGNHTKEEVYQVADRLNFQSLTESTESTGLCFAKGKNIKALLSEFCPDRTKDILQGEIVDRKGNIIGEHKGYPCYTIGQKRGLTLPNNKKLCVAGINPAKNRLVVDTWESLYTKRFSIHETYFCDPDELTSTNDLRVMIRGFGLNPGGNCHVRIREEGGYDVLLDEPAWAPAPGQPAVFYIGDRLIGGGLIMGDSDSGEIN